MTGTTTLVTEGAATTEAPATTNTGNAEGATLLDGQSQTSSTEAKDGATEGAQDAAADGMKTEEGGEDGAQKSGGAPEEYEEFALPEGMAIDPEVSVELKSLAKELDLDQAQAQKVAELGAKMSQRWTQALQSQIDANSQAWVDAAKADTEIGGDKLPESLGLAKTVLDKFGSPELRELLNASRLGNNPEVIRLLSKVGRAISDDSRVSTGTPPQSVSSSKAKVLFPSQQG